MKVSELIDHLQRNYQPDDEIAYMLWSADDVDDVIERRNYEVDEDDEDYVEMTPEEKDAVIVHVEHYADCEYGITWQNIEFAIDEVLEKRMESAE